MNATMNEDKFKGGIKAALSELLSEKEQSERLSEIENLLSEAESTITELTETVAKKNQEVASLTESNENLKTQLEELKAKAVEHEEKLSDLTKKSEGLEERASTAEKTLAEIESAKQLAARMAKLDEAKVAKSGDRREEQAGRIRGMSEEEFNNYYNELVEMRSELEAELKKVAEAAAVAAENNSGDVEEEVAVAPADIEKARKEAAVVAAVDAELTSTRTIADKYTAMGNQMAENMKNSRKG